MKTLIVEDDFTSRIVLQEFVKSFGPFHIAVNGREAVDAVGMALDASQPYDLICLDIAMPEMTGQEALAAIRALERERNVSGARRAAIIMVSSMADEESITTARDSECDYFIVKPVDRGRLRDALRRLQLIP